MLRESLELRAEMLPPEHWHIAQVRTVLGAALGELGHYQEAEELLLEGYAALGEALGEGDERTQEAGRRLVRLYELCGRPEAAESYSERLP